MNKFSKKTNKISIDNLEKNDDAKINKSKGFSGESTRKSMANSNAVSSLIRAKNLAKNKRKSMMHSKLSSGGNTPKNFYSPMVSSNRLLDSNRNNLSSANTPKYTLNRRNNNSRSRLARKSKMGFSKYLKKDKNKQELTTERVGIVSPTSQASPKIEEKIEMN